MEKISSVELRFFVRDKVGVLCEQIIYQNLFFAVVEYA